MKYVIGFIVFLGGIFLAGLSIRAILWQQHVMTDYVETPAAIISSSVETRRGRKSTTYIPHITYQYTFNERVYQGTKILTFSGGIGSGSAHDLVGRYPPSRRGGGAEAGNLVSTTKAYVNPQDPADAILVHQYMFDPYLFAYLSLFLALLGMGGALTDAFTLQSIGMQALALDDSGWQFLFPRQNLRRRLRNAMVWCVAWGVFIAFPEAHWLMYAGDYRLSFLILCLLPVGVWACFAVAVYRRWCVLRRISDVRLKVSPVPMQVGQIFQMSMEADAMQNLHCEGVTASVVCVEHYKERQGNKTKTGTRELVKKDVVLCDEATITAGQILEGHGEVVFQPGEGRPSSDLSIKIHPYYKWDIRLTIRLKHAVDYAAVYPLEVG